MSDALTQEMQDVIARNLPAQVGVALQARLAQADKDAAEVVSLNTRIKALKGEADVREAKITELNRQLKWQDDLDEREKALAKREMELELTLLKGQLAASEASKTFARDVALGLVRNVEYRNSVVESRTGQPVSCPPGYSVHSNYNTETHSRSEVNNAT